MKNNGTTHWRGHHELDLELGKKREPEVAVTLIDTSCGGNVAAVVVTQRFYNASRIREEFERK